MKGYSHITGRIILFVLTAGLLVSGFFSTKGDPSHDACSTFLLSAKGVLLVGHNLDGPQWRWRQEPGSVFINKRNIRKASVSGAELGAMEQQKALTWVSRYGSATFNGFGRELPDGGINEAGLVINEMGYGYNDYPYDDSLPTMMVTQWIQYQLDNYATVEEVIGNIRKINIVPWGLPAPIGGNNWHFFIADKGGDMAIIEFDKGTTKVFRGSKAPVPVLCNRSYEKDISKIKRSRGFGGQRRIIMKPKILGYWFNQGAFLVKQYDPRKNSDPVGYAFKILKTMQRPKSQQWSIVYDVYHKRVYFRTFFAPSIRYFDLQDFDFSHTEVKMLPDIHVNYSGEVTGYFVPYTYALNCQVVDESLNGFLKAFKRQYTFKNTGSNPEMYKTKRKKLILKILPEEGI